MPQASMQCTLAQASMPQASSSTVYTSWHRLACLRLAAVQCTLAQASSSTVYTVEYNREYNREIKALLTVEHIDWVFNWRV